MLSLWLTQRLKFFLNLFPECVARVPLSLWRSVEVWGLRVCLLDVAFTFATVRNRSQPFATVRNRSQPFATVHVRAIWPCLWGLLQKTLILFEVSNVAVTSLRVAGVALSGLQSDVVAECKFHGEGWYFCEIC